MTHWWLVGLIVVIVGFVTTYLKITIDRIFLVLLLVLWMGLGIQQAIVINTLVMLLASLLFFRGTRTQLAQLPATTKWSVITLSFFGGILGRWIGMQTSSRGLLMILGIYALLVGLRLLIIKPKMAPEGQIRTGVSVVTLLFSVLTGLISAGGKPLQIPILVKGFKLSMPQAYLVASLGTMASAIGFVVGELWFAKSIPFSTIAWSWIYFVGISLVMFIFEPLWNIKGQKWVTLIVGIVLTAVSIKIML